MMAPEREPREPMSPRFVTVPRHSLLEPYYQRGGEVHCDCYLTDVAGRVSLGAFVTAFMTTRLFRAERLVLRLAGRPSSDDEVRGLATGEAERFAAWTVEARTETELLLADATGRTRSYYAVRPGGAGTELLFGSAVLPRGDSGLGLTFRMLMPFHQIYAPALLKAAARNLPR